MGSLDTSSDHGAVEELETLFHSADPARSGLLSFSEFAYLILKSGGSQEQVDALIDQFSVPGRAQRMVCYAALLEQLHDSLSPLTDDESHKGTKQSPIAPPPPPPSSSRRPGSVEDPQSLPTHTTSGDYRRGTTLSSLSSTFPHVEGHAASRGASRASSLASSSSHPARRNESLTPHDRRSASGSAPGTPFHLSARFVASAMRAARQQSNGASRSRSRSASGPYSATRSDTQQPMSGRVGRSSPVEVQGETRSSPQAVSPLSPPPRLPGSSRDDTFRRMTQAAQKDVRLLADNSDRVQPSTQSSSMVDTQRKTLSREESFSSVLQQSERGAPSSSSFLANPRARQPQHHHDSVLSASSSFASNAARPALLSLRDVFHQHILPAAGSNSSSGHTVLVSELEDVFATRGIDVHPLELEAVVDSLELTTSDSDVHTRLNRTHADRSALSGVNSSTATTATVTGGQDAEVGLVDFCVLVSRLRPSVILRLRSPATWTGGTTRRGEGFGEAPQAAPAQGVAASASAALYRTPKARTAALAAAAAVNTHEEEEDEEASVMDVTVSPMTPPTGVNTPQSHSRGARSFYSSTLMYRPQQQQQGEEGAFRVDPRRPLGPSPQESPYHNSPTGFFTEETPPTARQLSADRHFSVSDTQRLQQQQATRRPSHGGYTQPTASSDAHQRPRSRAAAARASSSRPVSQEDASAPPRVRVSVRTSLVQPKPSHRTSALDRGVDGGENTTTTALSPRLLEVLQSAASAILLRCTQQDRHRTGFIPPHAWSDALRICCPSLRPEERRLVEGWLAHIRSRHASGRGEGYAEVVEDILTHRATATAGAAGRYGGGLSPSSSDGWSPSHHNEVSPASTTATTRSATNSPEQFTPTPVAEHTRRRTTESQQRLRETFLAVCGGDTDALHAYLNAFDADHRGYLHEHVWRAALEELFRRTTSTAAPRWVVDACYRLSRLPFDRVAAEERGGVVVVPSSAVEKAACTRVRRLSPARRGALCDYRFVLQELGLVASY